MIDALRDIGTDPTIDLAREGAFAFGTIRVRPSTREIELESGARELIEPRVMQVLVALAKHKGEVVSRDALIASCWNGRIVGDDAINRCIARIRRLAEAHGGLSVETIPRVGYRVIERDSAGVTTEPEGAGVPTLAPARRPTARVVALALVIVAGLLAAGLWELRRHSEVRLNGELPVVAVAPFLPLNSGDENRYFAAEVVSAVADGLTNTGMALASPGSDGAPADYRLFGTVRRDGAIVRIAVRLDDARFGETVFSHTFESGVGAATGLPDKVAASIASTLSGFKLMLAADGGRLADADEVRDFFRTINAIRDGAEIVALDDARHLVKEAPRSAIAQVSLAFSTAFALGNLPASERAAAAAEGREAARRAQALAPHFSDVYIPEQCLLSPPLWRGECEADLRKGLAVDSSPPWTPTFLQRLLFSVGRNAEAASYADIAFRRDPFSDVTGAGQAYALALEGREDELNGLLAHAARWYEHDDGVLWQRFAGIISRGATEEARTLLADKKTAAVLGPRDEVRIVRLMVGALASRDPADIAAADAACALPLEGDMAITICVDGLSELGRLDHVYDLLNALFPDLRAPTRAGEMASWLSEGLNLPSTELFFNPSAAALRADPRFIGVAERTGLLDYWHRNGSPDFCRTEHVAVCRLLVRRALS